MTPINGLRILFNGFVRRGALVPPQQIHLRESYSTNRVFEKILGLPPKPKRPASGYIRFSLENQPTVKELHPQMKHRELIRFISQMWNSASDELKSEYSKEFNEKKFEYMAQIREYNERLSDDDKKRIYKLRAKTKKSKANAIKRKQRHLLGKPKRPTNSFVKFMTERRLSRKPGTKAEHIQFFRDVGNEWKALSDAERDKYKDAAGTEAYKKAIYEWEAEMIRSGRGDIILSNPILPRSRSKKKKSKKNAED